MGPYTAQAAQQLLDERPLERSPDGTAHPEPAGSLCATARLEAACERGLDFDDVRYRHAETHTWSKD